MKKIWLTAIVLVSAMMAHVSAETIRVNLEPLPPWITADKQGAIIEMLQQLDKVMDLDFKITIVPLTRAKVNLNNGKADLIGTAITEFESEAFLNYALPIDWQLRVIADMYSTHKANVIPENYPLLNKIGVPRGNIEMGIGLTGLSREKFYDSGDHVSLIRMMTVGRVDAFYWERVSAMQTIQQLQIKGIYYQRFPVMELQTTLFVQRNERGKQLKIKIKEGIDKIDIKALFKTQYKLINLPDSGVVPLL